MAGIDDLSEVLHLLPIDHLDNDWVKSVWDKDFVELNELPIELQNELDNNNYCVQVLKDLQPKLTFWVNYEAEDESEVSFWTILVENDISYRHLIAFLASLIETASKTKVIMVKRHAGLLAACSYFQLASMSGSGAFKVFNPMLLNQCLDVLRKWTFTNTGSRKRKLSKSQSKGGRQKCRKVNKGVEVEMNDDGEDESDETGDVEELSPSEINTLYKALVIALKTFVKFLQKFSLRGSDSSILKSIQVMCELIRPFSGMAGNNNNNSSRVLTLDVEKATSPVELALIALKEICSSFQGNIAERINIVSKQLMSSILMLGVNNKALSGQNIPVAYSQARINAVDFVCRLIEENGKVIIKGVRTLIQHLCVKVPDKTEHRVKVSESIVKMMSSFDDISFAKMVKWILALTNTAKVGNRMIGLEILYLLLFKPELQPRSEDFPQDLHIYLTHKHLLTYIISRCSDSASSVRSRAIAIFSNCVASENQIIVNACQELFTPQNANLNDHPPCLIPTPGLEKENRATTPKDNENTNLSPMQQANKTPMSADRPVVITGQTPFVNLNFTPVNNNLPDNLGVLSMLKRRTSDEKVFVRKSALQAFESLIRIQDNNSQPMAVDILEERCRDPSLTVRKQAMLSLSSLLMDLPTNPLIQKAWLNGVLPLILDRESSLQEKCMKCLEEIILYNISTYSSSPSSKQKLMWDLLDIMSGEAEDNLRRYLQQAIGHWGRAKLIKTSHINALKTHIETENSVAAWMLLAELTSSLSKFNAEFVVNFWKENCSVANPNVPIMIHRSVLAVILNAAKMISSDDRQKIIADLKERLLKFRLHVDIISLTVRTMKTLTDSENCKKTLETVCQDLLLASDKFLSKVILNESKNPIAEEDLVICHLFTLGEVAQFFPAYVTHHILLLVQSIIASPCITEFVSKCSQTSSTSDSQESASQTNSQGLETASSQQKLSQGSSQGSEPLSQFAGSKWCSRVRGHAFITLGKLCLQNEKLAKKCIAALVRELETSSEEAIRNNVVFILCDLCIRYATLVDRYISRIAACLNDSSPLIRKQTLTLLTMLIQEDYLKWKGVLFYRFITTLLDEQKEIRTFAEYCLIHCLLVRNPNIMFYHFIECIFYFNNYQKHPMYNRFSQDQEDKNLVSLLGKSKSHLRQQLYAFMLQHMTDEQKFNLSAKLNQEILAGVIDGIIPLDAEGVIILQDTLVILGCKEIKLSLIVNKTPDENMDEEDMAAAVIATAKKNLITQVMKKNVIENIVPIVTSLKHLLETKRLPVLKELMLYLRELMKDFKNEIKEILISDKQLANEIEFDLRKFEEQQKLEEQHQQQSPALPELNGSRRMSISCAIVPTTSSATMEPTDQSNKPPVKQLLSGVEGISLSKQALLNSTRKSLKKIQNSPRRSSVSSNGSTSSTGGNYPNSDGSSHQMSKENTSPMDRGTSRAISTPFPNKSKNITFSADPNISVVPPSPIQQNNGSISDIFDSTSNATTSLNRIEKDKPDIIHLNSPDSVSAAPKIWKITPKKSLRKTLVTEELNPEDPNVSVGVGKIRAVRLSYK